RMCRRFRLATTLPTSRCPESRCCDRWTRSAPADTRRPGSARYRAPPLPPPRTSLPPDAATGSARCLLPVPTRFRSSAARRRNLAHHPHVRDDIAVVLSIVGRVERGGPGHVSVHAEQGDWIVVPLGRRLRDR